jgi:hypothetical protein
MNGTWIGNVQYKSDYDLTAQLNEEHAAMCEVSWASPSHEYKGMACETSVNCVDS